MKFFLFVTRLCLAASLVCCLFLATEHTQANPYSADNKALTVKYYGRVSRGTNVFFAIIAGNEIKEVKVKANGNVITSCQIVANRGVASFTFKFNGSKKMTFVGITKNEPVVLEGDLVVGNEGVIPTAATLTYNPNAPRYTRTDKSPVPAEERRIFIEDIKDDAIALARRYNVPASVIVGMAVLESGYGTSKVAVNANNIFGLKYWGKPNNEIAYQLVEQPYEGHKPWKDATQRTDNWYRRFSSRRECITFMVEELFLHKTGKWKNDYSSATRKYQQNIANGGNKEAAISDFLTEIVKRGYTGKKITGEGDYPLRVVNAIRNNNLLYLD
ncbi:MAG: glucosaminidase domain-containing protein [Spirosomataceae bacterium]|jgi:hypothetical protein|nr:glucosaminidase domain-containing protein [Flectobacillus sp.]